MALRRRINARGFRSQTLISRRSRKLPSCFGTALALYQERPDKSWSLTDCASFLIMDQRQTTEALTHDRHFEQRGYQALLRD